MWWIWLSNQHIYQLLVLVLHFKAGGDAVPGIEEGPALRMLHEVVHEDAHHIDTYENQHVGYHLQYNHKINLVSTVKVKIKLSHALLGKKVKYPLTTGRLLLRFFMHTKHRQIACFVLILLKFRHKHKKGKIKKVLHYTMKKKRSKVRK